MSMSPVTQRFQEVLMTKRAEGRKRRPKTRPDGTGSEYETSKGYWVATWPLPPTTEGKRRVKEFAAQTKAEAIAKRKQWLEDPKQSKKAKKKPSEHSVMGVGESWLANLEDLGRKRSTISHYRSLLETHVEPAALGALKIDRVKREHIEQLYGSLRAGGDSMRTRQAVHTTLNGLFKYAFDRELIDEMPMTRVKRPGGSRQARVKSIERVRIWTRDEVKAFLIVARNPERHYGRLFELMLGTGLRPGEAYALKWGVVDLDARTLRVDLELVDVDGKVTFETPKTEQARRTIPIGKSTCKLLGGMTRGKRGDLIFASEAATPCDRNNVRRALSSYAKSVGVPVLTPHELRHTHASQLLAANVPIKVVSERLGHRDVKTTLDLYQHLLPGMGETAAAEVDAILAG